MINKLKQMLLEEPENIAALLSAYDFEKISIRNNEIRFAHDSDGGANNISIRTDLEKNSYLNVADYSHGIYTDIFSYIIQERGVTFKDVLTTTKNILGLDESWQPPSKSAKLFGGVYDKIINRTPPEPKVYPEEILKQYIPIGNERFLKDHLSLASQRRFEIMYNVETQRIVIPIRNMVGELCGTKCRRNYETDNSDDPKYLFELPCQKNLILYGSFQNYQWLYGADKIFIFEAEKSTIACDSYGYRNAVSIMGNILSESQAKQLLSLNAKEYVFMLDEGLDLEVTFQNAKMLKGFAVMRDVKVSYFDWTQSLEIGEKESPTDGGKEIFEYIIENELIEYQQTT